MAVISPCRVCSAPAYDSDVCSIHSAQRYSAVFNFETHVYDVLDKHRGPIAHCDNLFDAQEVSDALNLLKGSS